MSGNTNMRPTGYRSKFGTTAKTAWEYWNIYRFAVAIGFHSLAKDALDAHFRVIEQELEAHASLVNRPVSGRSPRPVSRSYR